MEFPYLLLGKVLKRLKKGQKQLMADLKVTNDKVDALAAAFQTLQTDTLKALDDLKAEIGSNAGIPQSAIDSLNAKIDAIQSMVTATDTNVKAADPGTGGGSTTGP